MRQTFFHTDSIGRLATAGFLMLAASAVCAPQAAAQGTTADARAGDIRPDAGYYVYVAGESEDRIDLIRWGPDGAEIVESVPVGRFPTEIDGPHGLAVSPDGNRWFISLAHGNPFGIVAAYDVQDNRRLGATELGLFPATIDVSPAGLLFAVNFNLHGDHEPSSVSVVDTHALLEIARVPTCTMPHGSRFSPDGARHYSVCMMDEELVEIDAHRLEVARRFSVRPGAEGPLPPDFSTVPPGSAPAGEHVAHGEGEDAVCSPTWAQPSAGGARVFVACNRSGEVLEIDVEEWALLRRFPASRAGPYNLEVTPDGRLLIVTYKVGDATGIWDLESGEEAALIPTIRRLPHGIAVSEDGRYAFVSVEGVGAEPGTVEIIDLGAGARVAAVDVGKQAAGIAFWKMEPRNR